ncbi:MAG: adenine phosphoribosyltransferase [Pseudomonadota bacterium]|nr:adenine phosphoribosyltransferase [Pseudomonadota bacterium]
MDLKQHIRGIRDFPKPGILFYDISTLISDFEAWRTAIDQLTNKIESFKPDMLAGIESRGFLVAAPVALKLGIGFTMVRKKGKLPGETISHEYKLEYGTDTLEVQSDSFKKGTRIVLVDDLLATGGTMCASVDLLEKLDADIVGAACIIELSFLRGRTNLSVPFSSLVTYDE